MDTIYYNAGFHTMDERKPFARAVAVRDGRIAFVGEYDDARLALPRAKRVDLGGGTVVPGLNDTHMHVFSCAEQRAYVDLSGARSVSDVQTLCRAGIEAGKAQGGRLIGVGWIENGWARPVPPTRYDLDSVSTEIPIILLRACLHAAVVNTRALLLAGLSAQSPGAGTLLGIGADGELNGMLNEGALEHVIRDEMYRGDLREGVLDVCHDLLRAGITCVQSDDFAFGGGDDGARAMRLYRDLAEAGTLPLRVVQQCNLGDPNAVRRFLANGNKAGDAYGRYSLGAHKLLLDGSLGARTAYLRAPYADAPGAGRGVCLYTPEELYALIKPSHDGGMQIAAHAIGDAAIEMLLDALDRVTKENPRPDARHGVVHCQITDTALLERMARCGYLAYIQPIFVKEDRHVAAARVGENLCKTSYAWKRMLKMGVHASAGTDSPVEGFDAIRNLDYAVNRGDPSWMPEECLSPADALRLFTVEAAYAAFRDRERGRLMPGMLADMTVLDRDILAIPPKEIGEARVTMTIVDGEAAFSG